MKRLIAVSVFFTALLGLWELAARSGHWSPVLFPTVGSVGRYIWGAVLDGTLTEAIWVTLQRLLSGYTIGVVVGLPLGLLTSASQLAEDTLGALALGFQTLPSVCWVPLALLWFGQTEGAMLFVVVMGTVWSVIIATNHGARTIPPIYARAARHGIERAASLDESYGAGLTAISGEWHEAGMGICVEVTDGRRNLRNDPDRFRVSASCCIMGAN